MAATNKCLAQSSKSRTGGNATKKQNRDDRGADNGMMKMRTILLATVAGVLLTGNAIARDKCPIRNSNCQTARGDILEARKGALRDELTALREQIARAPQEALEQTKEQIKKMMDQTASRLQLAEEQGVRELKKQRDHLNNLTNKINTLKVQNGIPVEPVEPKLTKQINIQVGSALVWHAPKPFKTAIPGDMGIADIVPGETNADVVIVGKKEGFTNFVLVDGEGIVLADVTLQVGYPMPLHQVRVLNKKDNPSAYTSYQCPPELNHHCYRREDKMEGTDRTAAPSTLISLGGSTTPTGTPNP
jgi:Pilus formation protein N terminal region